MFDFVISFWFYRSCYKSSYTKLNPTLFLVKTGVMVPLYVLP